MASNPAEGEPPREATEGAVKSLDFQHFSVPMLNGHPLELGRGAMGITYKAYDRNLHVHVALKVINGAVLTSETARERFMREARSAAALRHPNVAAVFYLGEQEGSVFYAMEYVEGETIEAYIRREVGMPPALALKIVAQVASALAAAEKEGIIHRDIKPSNIMLVTSDDGELTVKVIDFGLAKSVETTPDSATVTLTQGGFLGTPHFASPEQLEEGEVDTRSDIYSLGVTLFYMLAGKTPFSGSMAQVMSQHLYRQPPIEVLEGQPAVLMELLSAMLAKRPEDRPQTALELRRRAEAALAMLAAGGGDARDPGARVAAGEVIGGRFTLAERIGSAGEFARFRARDAERSDEAAEVVLVDPAGAVVPGLHEEVRRRVSVVERFEAAAVRRVLAQGGAARGWFFAVEEIDGIPLLQVMKARRTLTLGEAMLVLRPLAELADAFQRADAPRPDFAPHEILLTPPADVLTPLFDWPSLRVKIDALRIDQFLDAPADHTVVQSSVAVLRRGTEDAGNAAFAVAGLAYEILGGARFEPHHRQWTPLAELTQGGNGVLRRALEAEPGFGTATEFLEALAREGASGLATAKPRTPEPPPAVVTPPAVAAAGTAVPGPADPPAPRARGSMMPLVVIGGLLLAALALGVGIFLVWPHPKPIPADVVAVTPTPAPSPTPDGTPRVISEPNDVPSPTPTSDEPERTAYAEELARARGLEQVGEGDEALLAYAKLAAAHPGDAALVEDLKRAADNVETGNPKGLSGAEFERLRPALETAAGAGMMSAQVVLGYSFLKVDPAKALYWFQEAARRGRSDAMAQAGMMLSSGEGVAEKDNAAAVAWFELAAARNDVNGITYLGECYLNGLSVSRDHKRAAELLTLAAEMGDDRAMGLLGGLYEKGQGVEKNPAKALDLYRTAVAAGNLTALAKLGSLHIRGDGTPRNAAEAVRLWKEGAEKGGAECMRLYAVSLEDPELGDNPAAALEWYRRAARAGSELAIEECRRRKINFASEPSPTPSPDAAAPTSRP